MPAILPYLSWFYTLAAISMFISGFLLRDRLKRRTPRTLVATRIIPISGEYDNCPAGLNHVIDGVRVREWDNVILTRQNIPRDNGWWRVHRGAWDRPRDIGSVRGAGSWAVPTEGRELGTLWIHQAEDNRWSVMSQGQNSRLLSYNDSNISPSDPLESAAFLLRLGVNPERIRGSRESCVGALVSSGAITEIQGDLFLAKPDNLTTHVTAADGSTVRLTDQTWTGQVRAYMASLQSTYERFIFSQEIRDGLHDQTSFRLSTPVGNNGQIVGFKRVIGSQPKPPDTIPRRSRYERDPVI